MVDDFNFDAYHLNYYYKTNAIKKTIDKTHKQMNQ